MYCTGRYKTWTDWTGLDAKMDCNIDGRDQFKGVGVACNGSFAACNWCAHTVEQRIYFAAK